MQRKPERPSGTPQDIMCFDFTLRVIGSYYKILGRGEAQVDSCFRRFPDGKDGLEG